jgi:hypothetical protein
VLAVAAVALLAAVALAGCSSSSKGTNPTPSSGASSSGSRHVLVATFADNGGTLTVMKDDRIRVVLAGTSWTYEKTSDTKIVTQSGNASALPTTSGCVTGQGCGSVTAYFNALKTGTANIMAARGSCAGAASSCTTGSGAFRLKVVVK